MRCQRYSVRLLRVDGPILFEVRRLCAGLVELEARGALSTETLRLATLCGGEIAAELTARHASEEPVIKLTNGAFTDLLGAVRGSVEHYDVSKAAERLTLLARLAQLAAPLCTAQPYGSCQLYEQVAVIQRVFSLHMTERDLAQRLGVDTSTLFRLFRRAGRLSPRRFLQWVRMYELAQRLAGTSVSAEVLAGDLGFRHAESAGRTMRKVVGMPIVALRTAEGLRQFTERMTAACQGDALDGWLPERGRREV